MSSEEPLFLLGMMDIDIKKRCIGMSVDAIEIFLDRIIFLVDFFEEICFSGLFDDRYGISNENMLPIKTFDTISIIELCKTLEIISRNPRTIGHADLMCIERFDRFWKNISRFLFHAIFWFYPGWF